LKKSKHLITHKSQHLSNKRNKGYQESKEVKIEKHIKMRKESCFPISKYTNTK